MNPNELLEAIERIVKGTEKEITDQNLSAANSVDARLSAYHAIKRLVEDNEVMEDE